MCNFFRTLYILGSHITGGDVYAVVQEQNLANSEHIPVNSEHIPVNSEHIPVNSEYISVNSEHIPVILNIFLSF